MQPLDHVTNIHGLISASTRPITTNIYGFTSPYARPITTRLGKMVYQYILVLLCRWKRLHHLPVTQSMLVRFMITKVDSMEHQHNLTLPWCYVNIPTSRSRDKHLWLYFHFYQTYNNPTYWDGKPACTKLTLQLMITSSQIDDVTNIHGFTSNITWRCAEQLN